MPLIPLSFEPAGLLNAGDATDCVFSFFFFFKTDLVPVKCLVKSTRRIDSAAAGALKALSASEKTGRPTVG